MRNYANIVEGVVQYILPVDGDITEMFHPDMVWVDVTEVAPTPAEGWVADDSDGGWIFSAPPPPVLSDDELKAVALAKRDVLIAEANETTVGMADAYLAGLLSPDEAVVFKEFATYKLALNKITKQSDYPRKITWPPPPADGVNQ